MGKMGDTQRAFGSYGSSEVYPILKLIVCCPLWMDWYHWSWKVACPAILRVVSEDWQRAGGKYPSEDNVGAYLGAHYFLTKEYTCNV